MTYDRPQSATRRKYLKTTGAALGAVLGASTAATAKPSGGGGDIDLPVTFSVVDDRRKSYNQEDYNAAAGLYGSYWGSYTNPNLPGSGYLHDFVISGFATARSRPADKYSWNLDQAISSETATIQNNKPDQGGIVSSVGTQKEWIGHSRRADGNSNDNYIDAMKEGVNSLVSEVYPIVGYYIDAQKFLDALVNDKGSDPEKKDEWSLSWNYGFLDYAVDCACSIRFAITSPEVGDTIDVTTKYQANIPTVNDTSNNDKPSASLGWLYETQDNGGLATSSTSVVESQPSTTVKETELPPYTEVQDMAKNGTVERVKMPLQVEKSTSG